MYIQEVKLHDNEKIIKVNSETGEVTTIPKRINNIPIGKEILFTN